MSRRAVIYFQIHQPYRINPITKSEVTDWRQFFIGRNPGKHGEDMRNQTIFEKVAKTCYLPATEFWLDFLNQHSDFQFTVSFSGTFLEQCLDYTKYGKPVLENFKKLIQTGRVEILDETYYHSLAFLVDIEEYILQILEHRKLVKKMFDFEPVNFRNTELIYSDHLGSVIAGLGYKSILVENPWWNKKPNIDRSLYTNAEFPLKDKEKQLIEKYQNEFRNQNEADFQSTGSRKFYTDLIFRDEKGSDGMMFVPEDPFENGLLAQSILQNQADSTNIFTDFEFLGEHDGKADQTLKNLQRQLKFLLKNKVEFLTVENYRKLHQNNSKETYSSPEFSSWGHASRDITVWRGGQEQEKAFAKLVELYHEIIDSDNPELLKAWRRISTSCHYYFLGKKEGSDADFVKLFSPYESVQQGLDIFLEVTDQIKNYFLRKSSLSNHKHGKKQQI